MRQAPPTLPVTEKQIEMVILRYLSIKKIFCWKQNSVGVYDTVRGNFRRPNNPYIISGVADILGIYKGKFLAIEVKTPKRKTNTSPNQKIFLHKVLESGGIAFVATSVQDVIDNLRAYEC